MRSARRARAAVLVWSALAAIGCERVEERIRSSAGAATTAESIESPRPPLRDPSVDPKATRSPTADLAHWEHVQRDLTGRRDPADGRGRAQLVGGEQVTARTPARFVLRYEAEPPGIAVGGSIEVRFPLTVGWSLPNLREPSAQGWVAAQASRPGVALDARAETGFPLPVVRFTVRGAPLEPGDRVEIGYASNADFSAERGERFWILVDGDGDGAAFPIAGALAFDVASAAATHFAALWPTTARPGERVVLHVTALDPTGNPAAWPGPVDLRLPEGVRGATRLEPPREGHTAKASLEIERPGLHTVEVSGPGELAGRSNPLVAAPGAPRVLWGDVHGHSNLSDGTGTPEDYFAYARDVAALGVAALTDHDHWGVPAYLDAHPEHWARIRDAVRAAHEPGRFVALLGFEWTSWLHGHRHVLHFADDGPLLSSADPRFETPAQLWDGLRGLPSLTFAHHPAGGPIATNWAFAPDPVLEPLVEIVSGAGSSEASDAPRVVHGAVAGNFVRDVLAAGDRLGFVGSGDSHDGHPGCPDPERMRRCGLVGIFADELSREDVLAALRARRSFATNGPRILLDARLDGEPAGSVVKPRATATLALHVVAPNPLRALEVVRGGRVVLSVDCERRREVRAERALADLARGESLYVRAFTITDGAAWASPFFVD